MTICRGGSAAAKRPEKSVVASEAAKCEGEPHDWDLSIVVEGWTSFAGPEDQYGIRDANLAVGRRVFGEHGPRAAGYLRPRETERKRGRFPQASIAVAKRDLTDFRARPDLGGQ